MPENSLNKDIFKIAFSLPPQEAINFLKNKAPEISYDWHDVYREAHVKAFTVAGLAKLDVLQDVQNALIEAQEKGQSLETFKQNFLSLLKKKGWYGKQTVKRPDGSVKEVNVSSPWRVKTIYRTNMATAAMAGMYKQLKTMADIMPYWRYVTVGDGRVREEHARIHGKILRHDDPFWDKYFPLNGYNCRCRVEALSEEEIKKKGLKVSDGRSMGYEVMPFVGTGWDYNPGKEDFRIAEEKYSKELKPIIRRIKEDARKAGPADVAPASKNQAEKYIGDDRIKVIKYRPDNNLPVSELLMERAAKENQTVSYLGRLEDRSVENSLKVLEYWEKIIQKSDVENAIIITKDGDVYRVTGTNDRVHPEIIDDLDGAMITHNHPKSEEAYGFSQDDLDFMADKKLMTLRLIDDIYHYQLSEIEKHIDKMESVSAKEMDAAKYINWYSADYARLHNYGYRRIKNE